MWAVGTRPLEPSTALPSAAALVVVPLASAVAATLAGPVAGLAALLVLPLLLLLRSAGAGRLLPRTRVGWLYVCLAVGTTVAPSLGNAGTALRFALAAAVLVALARNRYAGELRVPRAVAGALALYVLLLCASALMAASLGHGVVRLVNWTMFIPLLALVVRRPDVRGMATGVVLAATTQLVGVGLQALGLFGGTWGGLFLSGSSYDSASSSWLRRYTGFLQDPNNLALLMTLAVIASVGGALAPLPRRTRVLCLCLVPPLLVGLVLSGSRGGMAALLVGLLLLLPRMGWRGPALAVAAVGALVVAGDGLRWAALTRVLSSFADIVDGTDRSAVLRTSLWASRVDDAHPATLVLGAGFGATRDRAAGLATDAAVAGTIDNSWLRVVLESGLVAAAALALVLVSVTVGGLVKGWSSRDLVRWVSAAALAAVLFRSTSVDLLDINPWNALVWMLSGAALTGARARRGSRRPAQLPLEDVTAVSRLARPSARFG